MLYEPKVGPRLDSHANSRGLERNSRKGNARVSFTRANVAQRFRPLIAMNNGERLPAIPGYNKARQACRIGGDV